MIPFFCQSCCSLVFNYSCSGWWLFPGMLGWCKTSANPTIPLGVNLKSYQEATTSYAMDLIKNRKFIWIDQTLNFKIRNTQYQNPKKIENDDCIIFYWINEFSIFLCAINLYFWKIAFSDDPEKPEAWNQ